MYKKLSLLFAACLLAIGAWAKDIVIYHTTDMHGHYFGVDGKNLGGFARLETLLKNTAEPFLLLDSGDFSSGSYESSINNSAYSIELMNMVGYDALTIGNHDSDFGDKGLQKMLAGFGGDVLAMNISNLHSNKVKPHAVYDVDGVKVGVIGVAMSGSGMEGIKINDQPSAQEFEKQIQAVKKKGAEVIIILAHDSLLTSGVSGDKLSKIMETLPQAPSFEDVTLMLGGHAHKQTLVGHLDAGNGKGPWALEGKNNMVSVDKIVIHKDDETGEISVDKPEFVALTGQEDPEVKAYLDKIRVTELDERVYAYVPKEIHKYPPFDQADRAPAVARLMADQMYRSISKTEKIDLAAYSLNSTRDNYKEGKITGRYLAEKAPYDEHAGTFNISGSHLLQAMEASLITQEGNKCLSIYGYSKNVRMEISCNGQPKIERVTIDGKKLNPKKTYRMAMLTHLPRGFYEGKPFQVLASDAVDDGSVIKHYREVTSSAMLFGVVKHFKKEQKKAIPDFVAPSDVQITLLTKENAKAREEKIKAKLAQKEITKLGDDLAKKGLKPKQ